MSFLLISVVNRLGCESANVDNILTYKKIFVLALRQMLCQFCLTSTLIVAGLVSQGLKPEGALQGRALVQHGRH
jgi:hypothetical protein